MTRQMTPYSYLMFGLYPLVYFISAFQDLQSSVLWGRSFGLCSGLQNTHLDAKDVTLKPVNIYFFHIKFPNFGI